MIELSSCSYFQDDVDAVLVIEESVHFDDVGVRQKSLYFELSDELFSDFLFLQQFLLDHLESAYKACAFLSMLSKEGTGREKLGHTFLSPSPLFY